jgi:hypothetical protein
MTGTKAQNGILAYRLREVREEVYGVDGIPALARALGVPELTWANYERGVTLPAPILLALIEEAGVAPHWLLTGEGERFNRVAAHPRTRRAGASPSEDALRSPSPATIPGLSRRTDGPTSGPELPR